MNETPAAKMSTFISDQSGSTAIEYALIGSLIAVVIVGAVLAVNGNLTAIFETISAAAVPALQGDT